MRDRKNKMTLYSGVSQMADVTILFEIYRGRTEKIFVRLETLKKSPPIPILLYNTSRPHKNLILDGVLDFPISELESGSYEIRTAGDEIFRFELE